MAKKLALKLNEHNNGYMVMGRYAVRTSDLNNNDKGDSTRRSSSNGSDLPTTRCCYPGVASSARMYGRTRPTCRIFAPTSSNTSGRWIGSPGDFWRPLRSRSICRLTGLIQPLRTASSRSGCRITRLSRPSPTSLASRRTPINFHDLSGADRGAGLQVRMPGGDWLDVPYIPGSFAVNSATCCGAGATPVQIDAAPCPAAGWSGALCDPVLPRPPVRPADRMLADLYRPRQSAALGADHLR